MFDPVIAFIAAAALVGIVVFALIGFAKSFRAGLRGKAERDG